MRENLLAADRTDFWADRFAPAAPHNAGAGEAMYRKCLKCGSHAMEGALSAHARWCDKEQHKRLTLAIFDDMAVADRRHRKDGAEQVRAVARRSL